MIPLRIARVSLGGRLNDRQAASAQKKAGPLGFASASSARRRKRPLRTGLFDSFDSPVVKDFSVASAATQRIVRARRVVFHAGHRPVWNNVPISRRIIRANP